MNTINRPFFDQNNFHLLLFCTIFLSLVFKLALLSEPFGSDDLRYFEFAKSILSEWQINNLDHAASRIIFLVLVGFPGAVVGNILGSSLVNILIASATELFVAYYCLSRFGPIPSLLAVIFLAFNGVVLTFSGYLIPDPLLGLFWLLSAVTLICAFERNSTKQYWLLFASGLFAGLGYSAKDTGILIIPVSGLFILYQSRFFGIKKILNCCAVYLVGVLCVWFLECSLLALLSGDFFYKFRALSVVHNNGDVNVATDVYNFITVGYWNFMRSLRWPAPLLMTFVLALVCGIAMLRKRNKYSVIFFITSFIFLYLCFGSSSFSKLVNLPVQSRYFQPLLPLVAICIAASFSIVENRTFRVTVISMVAVSIVIGVTFSFKVAGNIFYQSYVHNAILGVSALAENGYPIFVDNKAKRAFSARYLTETEGLTKPIPPTESLATGYYLFDPNSDQSISKIKNLVVSNAKYSIRLKKNSRPFSLLFYPSRKIKYSADFYFFEAGQEAEKNMLRTDN